jgi:hypothetical protein|tara:strand:+ start:174 stop:434 length:261 start_codon:yes stop_codon:yes gene_type:complete
MSKKTKFNKEIEDARKCFMENVSESCFPWRAAFNSYLNYIETLHNYCKDDSRELAYEIRVCSELLERKKIDPNSIGTTFAIYKNLY